ncbi:unnamed protein product [Symbiodinium microadriaticum]|nr:unnamed protein product [Symbiodinium microadriaticum]
MRSRNGAAPVQLRCAKTVRPPTPVSNVVLVKTAECIAACMLAWLAERRGKAVLHPACLLRLEGLKVSLAGENPNRNPSCFVSELWEARLGAMASSTPISGPRWWGWSFSLALFGALLACGLLTMVPNLGASTSVPRRLAQGTKSADELSASAAEEGGEDGENDKEPFWQQALEGLVEEGAEIAKQDAMGTGPVATSATNASCEEHLRKGNYVAAFSKGCAFVENTTKYCFDTMDRGTSTQWLLGSMLRDCLEEPKKWRQTWQACDEALCNPSNSSCLLDFTDFRSVLRTACVRSCLQLQEGCPGRHLPQSQWSKMMESNASQCTKLMDRFVDRLTIYEGYDTKTFDFHGVSFQDAQEYPSSHFYDRFLLLHYCSKEGSDVMRKVLFGDFPASSFGQLPMLNPRLADQTLHEAMPGFLGKEALPSALLVAEGWSACHEIIDNGIANVTADTIRQCRSSCEQTWVPSSTWHEAEGKLLHSRIWLWGHEIPTRWRWLLALLCLLLCFVVGGISIEALCFVIDGLDIGALIEKAEKTLWDKLQILGAFVVKCVAWVAASCFIYILFGLLLFCLAGPVEYMFSVASGHGPNWVCTKSYLYQDWFDPKLQYIFGAVALMFATGLASVVHSGQSEGPAMPPRHVVGHLLLAEMLMVLCPACFGLVAQSWAPLQIPGSVWWIIGSSIAAFGGFVIFVAIAKCCGRSVLEDAADFMKEVPGKLMMLDVFMDVSQMATFVLIGQPFFGLAQAFGVLTNAFLSEVAPYVTSSEKLFSWTDQVTCGWLGCSKGSSAVCWCCCMLFLFGVLCWFVPVVRACVLVCQLVLGFFLYLALMFLAILPAIYWTCTALGECCRRWRAFTFAIFQADVLPIIWNAYKAEVEPLAFLRKKAAEATGEGTVSLYVGLTALFKARLAANSSVTAMAFILINSLVTTYSMQSGLTCLEMMAAEEERVHQAFPRGSGEWWLADARRPTGGRLIQEEHSVSRARYESTRSISDVSMLRRCETLSITVPFVLLAACYNFVVALLVYLIVGCVFQFASLACGHREYNSVLVPFLPWREPVTAPTASGSFAWAGASRLAATSTSWLILVTENLWAPFLPDWAHLLLPVENGSHHYWSEKRQWLEEGGLSLAELLQALIIFSGGFLGVLAWFGYCYFWLKFLKLRQVWLAEDSARLILLAVIDLFRESSSEGVGEADDIWLPDSPELPKFDDLREASDQSTAEANLLQAIYPEFRIEDRAMFHCQPGLENGTQTIFLRMPKAQWVDFLQTCPAAFPKCVASAFLDPNEPKESKETKMFVGYPEKSDPGVTWRVHIVVLNGQCTGCVYSSSGDSASGEIWEIAGTWSSTAEMKWKLTTNEFGVVRHVCLRWHYPPEKQPGEPARRPCLVMDWGGVLTEVSHQVGQTPDAIDAETDLMYVLPGCSLFQGQALQPGRPLSELPEGCEVYEVSVVEFHELPEAMTSLHGDWRFIGLRLQNHPGAEEQDWFSFFKEILCYLQEKVTGRPSNPVYARTLVGADQ